MAVPYWIARVWFRDEEQIALVTAVPGVKERAGVLSIPYHAVKPVDRILRCLGLTAAPGGYWKPYPPPEREDPEAILRRIVDAGEMTPEHLTREPPFPWQLDALAFAVPRDGTLLKWPTGSGKTRGAILWALARPGPVAYLTPAKARSQMVRQVERYTTLRAFACKPEGQRRKRLDDWIVLDDYVAWCFDVGQRPFVVVGWESLPAWIPRLRLLAPASVIYDEVQYRGKSWKRWAPVPMPPFGTDEYRAKEREVEAAGGFVRPQDGIVGEGAAPEMIGFVPYENVTVAAATLARTARRRLATTATPVKDRGRDLWSPLDYLEPGAHGSWTVYSSYFCARRPGSFGGVDTRGSSHLDDLADRLSHVMHEVPAEVTQRGLPMRRRETIYIEPDDQDTVPTEALAELEAQGRQAHSAGAALEVALARAAWGKRGVTLYHAGEYLSDGRKVVLFMGRRRLCEWITDEARTAFKGIKGLRIWSAHGGRTQAVRQRFLDEYGEHSGPGIFIGTGDAYGLAMDGFQYGTAASFHMQLPWTLGDVDQQEGRFYRAGQWGPCTSFYPVASGTVDDRLVEIVLAKLPVFERVGSTGSLVGIGSSLGGIEDAEALARSILSKIGALPPKKED